MERLCASSTSLRMLVSTASMTSSVLGAGIAFSI